MPTDPTIVVDPEDVLGLPTPNRRPSVFADVIRSRIPPGARARRLNLRGNLPDELLWLTPCTNAWAIWSDAGRLLGVLARSSEGWTWSLVTAAKRIERPRVSLAREVALATMGRDVEIILHTLRIQTAIESGK